jgi:hypothetical protein
MMGKVHVPSTGRQSQRIGYLDEGLVFQDRQGGVSQT